MLRLALVCLLAAACQRATPATDQPAPVSPAPIAAPPVAEPPPAPKEPEVPLAPVAVQPAMDDDDDLDCNVEGFVVDPDPAGLNVRADASGRAQVVGKIAFVEDGTILEIIGARNGWLQVRRARPIDGAPYEVSGWVSGQMVETSVRCDDDEPGPDCTAALLTVPAEGEPEHRRLAVDSRVKIVGCRGRWVQAQTTEPAREKRAQGWLSPATQCGNPVTTCP